MRKTIQHTVAQSEQAPLDSDPNLSEMGVRDNDYKLVIDVGEDYDDSAAQVFLNGARVPSGTAQWTWNRPTSTNDVEIWWPVCENDMVIIDYDTVA